MKHSGWIITGALAMATSSAHAASFAARPTFAQAEKWVTKAAHTLLVLDERWVATSDHQWPQGRRTRSGSVSNLVSFLKQDAVSLASQYLDQSKAPAGNYNEWFKQNPSLPLPKYNRTSLITHAGVPSDVEGKTPGTVIANLGPASSTHGLDACAAIIGKLSWLPIRYFDQSNLVSEASVYTNIFWHSQDINRGDKSENGCFVERFVELIEDGQQGVPRCEYTKSAASNRWTRGSASWFVQGGTMYRREMSQQGKDFQCGPCAELRIWDLTRILYEQHTASFHKAETLRTEAYCQLTPSIRGNVEVYSSLNYSTRESQTGSAPTSVGCDQQGTFSFNIPEWNPEWSKTPIRSGSGRIGWASNGINIKVANPANVKLPESSFVVFQQDRVCDTRTGPKGFGVWCFGMVGSLVEESRCQTVIPDASADMSVSHALVKILPRYTP